MPKKQVKMHSGRQTWLLSDCIWQIRTIHIYIFIIHIEIFELHITFALTHSYSALEILGHFIGRVQEEAYWTVRVVFKITRFESY